MCARLLNKEITRFRKIVYKYKITVIMDCFMRTVSCTSAQRVRNSCMRGSLCSYFTHYGNLSHGSSVKISSRLSLTMKGVVNHAILIC